MKKFTINDFAKYKVQQQKITMVTAYDFISAQILEQANVDTILVGDSLGMVIQGQQNTVSVTLKDILYHTKAVRKGAPESFIIADMPYLSYHLEPKKTIKNAALLICEGNANAVKLEINHLNTMLQVEALIAAQIPVIGHIGMTPQSVNIFGGFKIQGKTRDQATHILNLAIEIANSGVSALVLECIPIELAAEITHSIAIPTIGIGAGNMCDGQVLVFHDLLGLNPKPPKFAKQYCNSHKLMTDALEQFIVEVKDGSFPNERHSDRLHS